MSEAKRDNNRVTTLLGVSSADGVTPIPIQVNPATGRVIAELATGVGDMLIATYDPAGISEQLVGLTAVQTLTNKTLTSPVLNTGVSGTAVLDEDDMVSDSATQLATQQSIKAYVDAQITAEDFWDRSGIGLIPNTAGDSIGLTGTRISKGWFTDLEVTNAIAGSITGSAATVTAAAQPNITSVGTLTSLAVTNNITVGGTVDGRDLATDGTKLDGIEALADVTDATNVDAAGATMNADTTMAGNGYFLDEDNMASDSATKVASQQSIKAYVDGITRTLQQVFDAGQTITIADTDNQTLLITNNDVTNDQDVMQLINNTAGTSLYIRHDVELDSNQHALQIFSGTDQDNSALVKFSNGSSSTTQPTLLVASNGGTGIEVNVSALTGAGPGLFIDDVGAGSMVVLQAASSSMADNVGITFDIVNSSSGREGAFQFNGSEHDTNAHGGSAAGRIKVFDGTSLRYIYMYSD